MLSTNLIMGSYVNPNYRYRFYKTDQQIELERIKAADIAANQIIAQQYRDLEEKYFPTTVTNNKSHVLYNQLIRLLKKEGISYNLQWRKVISIPSWGIVLEPRKHFCKVTPADYKVYWSMVVNYSLYELLRKLYRHNFITLEIFEKLVKHL